MRMKVFFSVFFCAQLILASAASTAPEHSVARQWNEVLLEAIRQILPDLRSMPAIYSTLQSFYNFLAGGDTGRGHVLNPYTGKPYPP